MSRPAPDPPRVLVELDGVTCHYGEEAVLEDVDLAVRADGFVGIVGPSGAGKTTLLRALMGTITPTSGRVQRADRLAVGYVPQVETVDWHFPVTVAECVLMARTSGRVLPWPSPAERREVAEVLDRLGIGELAQRHIRQLSGGQQQRVFIARALLRRPDLLLLGMWVGVDDAVDGLRRRVGVQGGEDEVTGLGCRQGRRDRFRVPHLSHDQHIRVLTQSEL